MFDELKIEDVALFERIAQTGSISAAGKLLGLKPTLASERLARLERKLGTTLATRTTRNLSLTDEGRRFLAPARDLLSAYKAARESVADEGTALEGHIRVTAPSLFGRLFMPELTVAFLNDNPDVRISLSLSDRVSDYAAEGIDMAIRIAKLSDSTFRGRRLGDNQRTLCAAPAYLEKRGQPQSAEDLQHHDCLVFAGEDDWTIKTNGDPQTIRVSGPLQSDSADLIRSATIFGLGISLRSLWDIHDDLEAGRLTRVLPDSEIDTQMAIWAIFPPGRYTSRTTRAYAQTLKDALSQWPFF